MKIIKSIVSYAAVVLASCVISIGFGAVVAYAFNSVQAGVSVALFGSILAAMAFGVFDE